MNYLKPAILALLALNSCSSGSPTATAPPPNLPVITLTSGEVTTYQQYPVSIEGTENVEIRPQVSGRLEKIFVDEGALVTAGQPLFRIDAQPFNAVLIGALASLHAAESAAVNTDLEIEKLTPLVQSKVISDYQLKTARAAAGVAKANIEQARANVTTARINLAYTLIKAPVDGFIGRLLKKKGSLVSPSDSQALTELSDVRNVHIYFSFAEKDFVTFKSQYEGATLHEKLKNLPDVTLLLSDNSEYPIKGRIDMIDGQFNKNTGAITIRANFLNPKGLLRSGNTGKIQLGLVHKNVVQIPTSATVEVQDRVFVFALADSNKVKKQLVTIAGRSGNNYVIKDGVRQGDRIVTNGIGNLQEGIVIRPETAPKVAAIQQ